MVLHDDGYNLDILDFMKIESRISRLCPPSWSTKLCLLLVMDLEITLVRGSTNVVGSSDEQQQEEISHPGYKGLLQS